MDSHQESRLLNDFQRDFPLVATPFSVIAEQLGCHEEAILQRLTSLVNEGKVSRVGPVFAPQRVGASTLVAMAVPPEKLADVALMVNGFPGVNHNYEREHHFNLWFVLTAVDKPALNAELINISQMTGYDLLPLPLLEAFHIDLGFCLHGKYHRPRIEIAHSTLPAKTSTPISVADRQLIAALQGGIPLTSRPFESIANACGLSEQAVLSRINAWITEGVVKRFGVIVRHHELGFSANAMLVHNIPDTEVSHYGQALAKESAVTLCYRRPRRLPDWRHNLFCMIHGRQRDEVEATIHQLRQKHGLMNFEHEIIFSKTRFKQNGARYA